jgi:hypothetical protein
MLDNPTTSNTIMKQSTVVPLLWAIALASATPFVCGEGNPAEKIEAAKNFKIEGVSLKMSKTEFLRVFPNAEKSNDLTDVATGTVGFQVQRVQKIDAIRAAFWNDKLIEMQALYSANQLNKMGGHAIVLNRLVKLFGQWDNDSPGQVEGAKVMHWRIPEAGFYCAIILADSGVIVKVADVPACAARAENPKEPEDPNLTPEVKEQQIANAREFNVEGIRLGMSEDEFLRILPQAIKTGSPSGEAGESVEFKTANTPKTDGIEGVFVNGKVTQIKVWYGPNRLNDNGGNQAIIGRLKQLFGDSPQVSYDKAMQLFTHSWHLKNADFSCRLHIHEKVTLLEIQDTKSLKGSGEKKVDRVPGL